MIVGILCIFLMLLSVKYMVLKRQIRGLADQVEQLSCGATEKILELSLIDRDLERLAGLLNTYIAGQRTCVAEALRHEEHLKTSVADISHDLRTPLTVIMGHLQLLLKSPLSPEQLRRVETALKKAGRMKELTESFYEMSVLDGDKNFQWERINFSNLLMDFLTENAPLFEQRQIRPNIRLPDTSVYIRADRKLLERILQNLLVNAVRYTAGEINIALSGPEEGKILFRIDNTVEDGNNIEVDRLFDRFYTADPSRHSGSTGLGLAVVKLLAEKLGGTVSAGLASGFLSMRLILSSGEGPLS